MAKYKILEEFVLNGMKQEVGTIVELDHVRANLKSIAGKIEKVNEADLPKGDGSVLGSIKPGEALTPEQKEKLAKENIAMTAEAHRLAGEHRQQDVAEGKATPVVAVVAESLKEKLENLPPLKTDDQQPAQTEPAPQPPQQ